MPVPRRIAGVLGDWHIWVYWSAWSLSWRDREIATSESTDLEIDRAFSVLNGQSLTAVTVGTDDGRSSFAFDLSCILRTWPARPYNPSGTSIAERPWPRKTLTETPLRM
jgi:hypothetical protein